MRIRQINLHVLNMRTRMPFRYGIVTLTALPHLFVRIEAEIDGKTSVGFSADHLPPKWFTKDPNSHVRDDLTDMIACIRAAASHALDSGQHPNPFHLWRELYARQKHWASDKPHPPLLWHFGVSFIERAAIDAFCRAHTTTFPKALSTNSLGIDLSLLSPQHPTSPPSNFLPKSPPTQIISRHTVGLVDPLTDSDIAPVDSVTDGLPQSLESAIRTYGLTHFKIKLGGDVEKDSARLRRLSEVISKNVPNDNYAFTLDANENFKDIDPFRQLWISLSADPALKPFLSKLLFIEQPVHRDVALSDSVSRSLRAWPNRPPMIIDESDGDLSSLPRALECGYVGTSHKNCKGVFKSIANACLLEKLRREKPNQTFLLSGEDLSNVGPIALNQDCAVAASLGISHLERNGHHYFTGLAALPNDLQQSVLSAHPDLYHKHDRGFVTPRIQNGQMNISSLLTSPFALGFDFDPRRFTPLDDWKYDSLHPSP